jgi:RNA polymerase sigma-70 factor (ECF subfamily)
VYRRCVRLLRDRDAARDATQEVFVRLVRDADRLADPDAALAWIHRVATNYCLNLLRQARRHGVHMAGDSLDVLPDAAPAPSDLRLARQVLARFDVQTQEIAMGALVDGMNHDEIAGALGISRRTVRRKLARFLDRARALLRGREP